MSGVRFGTGRGDVVVYAGLGLPEQRLFHIDVEWTSEAAADPVAMISDPDPQSRTGAVRIVGYSPTAGFVLTVIAVRLDGELWGVTAWKTAGAERRRYQEVGN